MLCSLSLNIEDNLFMPGLTSNNLQYLQYPMMTNISFHLRFPSPGVIWLNSGRVPSPQRS